MPQTPTITDVPQVIVAQNDAALTITLTQDGATWDLTSASVICSIYDERDERTPLLEDLAVSLVTAASGIVLLTLSDVQTAALHTYNTTKKAMPHIMDFEVTEADSSVTNSDPLRVWVRKAATT